MCLIRLRSGTKIELRNVMGYSLKRKRKRERKREREGERKREREREREREMRERERERERERGEYSLSLIWLYILSEVDSKLFSLREVDGRTSNRYGHKFLLYHFSFSGTVEVRH